MSIRPLAWIARGSSSSSLRHLWLDAGYNGRGKGSDWVEPVVGWTVKVLRATHRFTRYWVPNDMPPDQIAWSQYLPEPGFPVLPRRWVVERTQSQYRQSALDVQTSGSHDRSRWAAQAA